eukprot:15048880-Ditylum_brightwellii.AAC.1
MEEEGVDDISEEEDDCGVDELVASYPKNEHTVRKSLTLGHTPTDIRKFIGMKMELSQDSSVLR